MKRHPTPWLLMLLLFGCPAPVPFDDDVSVDDDDTADDDDDTTPPTDICDDFPGEIICDGDTEITCDAYGDIAGEEVCDTANGFYCFYGLGCVMCYPGERWCEGDAAVVCAPDGQSFNVVEICDAAAGQVCEGGECVSMCDQAEDERQSIGCLFYGIDMEQHPSYTTLPYAIVVSNVHDSVDANVTVETKSGGVWSVYDSGTIGPQSLQEFNLPNNQITGSGLVAGNAYRVTSTIPVIAYQFNPLDGVSSYTSDASLLLPASAYDTFYRVPGWGSTNGSSEVNVVAEVDGTQVWVTPTTNTSSGAGVPAGTAGVQMQVITLDEGDVLQIAGSANSSTLEGTIVEASERVAVFAGHSCANIPPQNTACDHIEEQIFGLQTWGTEYLAARMPARANPPEISVWHFLAGNDPVALTFEAEADVTGMPPGNTLALAAGESVELQVAGSVANPGDFRVTGDEAFLVTQYMIGGTDGGNIGDPCMMQAVPSEQFLDNYVVMVASTWINDKMTLTREPGASVIVDGIDVDSWPGVELTAVGPYWEVVRITVDDGPRVLEGSQPFGVQVVGYDDWDSYCYPGGLNQEIINDL